jgi:hypothetical protein
MKNYLLVFFICLGFLGAHSQSISTSVDSLRFYGDAMFSLRLKENKSFAENQFLNLADRLVQDNKDSSLLTFHPSFIITESKDKFLKIVSWQIENESKEYRYYAFIFSKDAKPILIRSQERNLDRINYETFNKENWYGAMYYHFLPEIIGGFYTVFGYRFSKEGYKYRIIEMIRVNEDTVEFGSPIFKVTDEKGGEDFLYRKLISYSASANVALRYDEEVKMIYFDHIDRFTDPKSGELLRAPDGTFEAFELKNNYWNYIPYHKLQILETAPREKPVLDNKSKDLFGRDKKK